MPLHYGEGVLNTLINKLPFELHIPGYQFCGPGTKLEKRLLKGQKGVNPLDSACRQHDIAYSQSGSLQDRHKTDKELENRAWERFKSRDAKFGEKASACFITTAMKTKRNLGMGMAAQKRKRPISFRRDIVKKVKRILGKTSMPDKEPVKKLALHALKAAKQAVKKVGGKKNVRIPRIIPFDTQHHSGGFLPLIPLFAGLSALGSLAGGASVIAKTVIDAKKKVEAGRGLNSKTMMEPIGATGSGLYVRKNRRGGFGLFIRKHPKKLPIKLPKRPLTDLDLIKYAKMLKIPNFKGVFMRDTLPDSKMALQKECAILNLDSNTNKGTHWVAYSKNGNMVQYFDSFGALKPPIKLVRYLKGCRIIYNNDQYQRYNQVNCGHLCLEFLYKCK
ncbi:hypothetical protein NQ315_014594 [Exocentrus adspersus]|uniref:Phospholipase A2-like domain-containing protein n=1 Tax=Exocentrus adspersus TaxID=1586481 RepID=A0AAV8VQE7_9CUCU|nr:hypothetical protein NQ315_014594 [Exocentrus adspersus]